MSLQGQASGLYNLVGAAKPDPYHRGRITSLAAEQSPTSYVVGTDLSKIQPENHPPNCEFFKTDSEEEWIFPHVPKFDYIHLRLVCMSFNDPKGVLQHAWDNLNPGGWIEYHDMYPCTLSYDGSHEGRLLPPPPRYPK
jgi:SAM-dependent methyltransferase